MYLYQSLENFPFTLWWVIFFIFLFLFWFFIRSFQKKNHLNQKIIQKICEKIKDTKNLEPKYSILESHKIFVKALSLNSKIGQRKISASQKIKICEKYFLYPDKIWKVNRIRNQIAHETQVKITRREAEKCRFDLMEGLKSLRKF